MVDAVVSYAVQKLGDFIIQEAVFSRGIKGEVKSLQSELRLLRSYLQDAEQKQGSDERIRAWISELQEIAYDTEDTIEIFIFRVNNEQIHSSTWGRMGRSLKNCFCCICKNAKLYDIGKDIEKLKKRVLEISRQRETYGINNLSITQNNKTIIGGPRITTSYGDEDLDVVGFEDDVQFLQAKLFNGVQSCSVISILGMGGLGKTTLARKLYNNNKIKFTLHAWICVSQEWKTEDLLKKLIKSFVELTNEEREKVDKMELFELERYLRNFVEDRQYLVVIDDVWHREAWESIKKAFPDNKNGSRIIITTRKEDVATLSYHRTYVHKLRFLRFEESWSLFCKKAFSGNNGECPNNHFEKLGKEMTAKCGGLPLAIIVLGGLLSRKQFHEWHAVKEHIWREVKENSMSVISPILDLSYNDLPIDIKSCFLYLCIFSEDALIEVEHLVKLWVAEEFIPIDEEGRTLEEVSECYFKELLGRNLVQTVERNWRMTSSCRVHDLLRDLALKKARETNFLRVHDQIGSSSSSLRTTSCRRFVVHLGLASEELLNHWHKKVRTLYILNDKGSIDFRESVSIVWSFRLLRVLKIEGVSMYGERESRFIEGVGEMIHLRYLALKDTYVDKLPNSVRNLKALQTLYIHEPRGLPLPKDIGKLKELRHLTGEFYEEGCLNLTGLSNLQTFKLYLVTRRNMEETDFDSDFLATLNNLRSFEMLISLVYSPLYRPISIEPLLNCKELIELKIMGAGAIREVPKDIHKYLTKLKYLQLRLHNKLEEDPIPKLEMLPNLLALHLLYCAVETTRWTFTANGFPQLEFLKLQKALNMEWRVEERAMPRLRFLCLEDDKLKQVHFPERFWSLPGEEAMNWKFTKNLTS